MTPQMTDKAKERFVALLIAKKAVDDQLKTAMQKQPESEVELRALELHTANAESVRNTLDEMMNELREG